MLKEVLEVAAVGALGYGVYYVSQQPGGLLGLLRSAIGLPKTEGKVNDDGTITMPDPVTGLINLVTDPTILIPSGDSEWNDFFFVDEITGFFTKLFTWSW